MLKIENLTCGYGEKEVLHQVSFSLASGEKLCVLGPNGCGKTTLMRAIAGLLPYEGNIHMGGLNLKTASRRDIAQKIALMSQVNATYFPFSVYDTVMMGRYAHRSKHFLNGSNREDERIVLDCLDKTDTLRLRDKLITELSGGQLQRVFLARTYAQSPQLILLDEPTNHLDLQYQLQLVEYLKTWTKEKNRCLIGAFHDINLALSLADSLLVLQEGHVLAHCPAEQFDPQILSELYQIDIRQYMRESLSRWI